MPAALDASTFYYPTTYGAQQRKRAQTQTGPGTPTGSGVGAFAPTKTPAAPATRSSSPTTSVAPAAAAPSIASFAQATGGSAYAYDPVLAAINAQSSSDVAQAETSALDQKRKVLTQLGSADLARSVLGNDDPTLGAISSNPDTSTSSLARINRYYRDQTKTTNDGYNVANLWYSSARAGGLGDLAHDQLTDEADATAGAQDSLAKIGAALLDARNTATRNDAAAAAQAQYQAAVLAALTPQTPAPTTNVNPGGNPITNDGGSGTGLTGTDPGTVAGSPDYPYLNPSSPDQVYTPVTVGSSTSAEPRPSAGNYIPSAGSARQAGAAATGHPAAAATQAPTQSTDPGGSGYVPPPDLTPPDISQPVAPAGNVAQIADPSLDQLAAQFGDSYSNPSYGDANAAPGDWQGTPSDISSGVAPVGNVVQYDPGPDAGAGSLDDIAAAFGDAYGNPSYGGVPASNLAAGQAAVNQRPRVVPGRGRAL